MFAIILVKVTYIYIYIYIYTYIRVKLTGRSCVCVCVCVWVGVGSCAGCDESLRRTARDATPRRHPRTRAHLPSLGLLETDDERIAPAIH